MNPLKKNYAGAVYQAVSGIVSGHVWGAAYWVVYATVDGAVIWTLNRDVSDGVMKYARNDAEHPALQDFLGEVSSGAEAGVQ